MSEVYTCNKYDSFLQQINTKNDFIQGTMQGHRYEKAIVSALKKLQLSSRQAANRQPLELRYIIEFKVPIFMFIYPTQTVSK